jgi:putative cardiolipin synthase
MSFSDLDVLAIGPAVNEVTASFEQYWASDSSYPAESLLPPAPSRKLLAPQPVSEPDAMEKLALRPAPDSSTALAATELNATAAGAYLSALHQLPIIRELLQSSLDLEWAPTQLVVDDPAKGLGRAAESEFLLKRLRQVVGKPVSSLQIVSPYFVPTAELAENFGSLARSGVKVQILTNSLEATDVAIVHAAYAKWRVPLLASGVEIFELKPRPGLPLNGIHMGLRGSLPGSSGTSLHAKVMAVDDARFFVGSFNLDRRSRDTNTEMGLLIDSPLLAKRLSTAFLTSIPKIAYRLSLSDSGQLRWTEQTDAGHSVVRETEPGSTIWQSIATALLSILPLDFLF